MILSITKRLEKKIKKAQSYTQWKEAALAHDLHSGSEKWKQQEISHRYDYQAIRRRLNELNLMRHTNNNHGLLFILNEGIHGNLGGMGHADLYQQSKFGTKQLISDYVKEVSSALELLATPQLEDVSLEEQADFFHRAQLCYGRSALLMSGSGTNLFFHVGVLKALCEQNLIPEVLSGSSGGSLIASIAGTRTNKQLRLAFNPKHLQKDKELTGIIAKLANIGNGQLTQSDLDQSIERMIPDLTFAQAYEISGIQINISITPAEKHQKSRLLNAITSPNVMIREAVKASCSVPGIFAPVTLAAKNVNNDRVPYLPSRKWIDGSFSDDLPMKRLSRLYGVNHFIVSQTNPIALPFINAEKYQNGLLSTLSQTGLKTMKEWGLAASHIAQIPLKPDSSLSKLINGYISVLSQTYTGDINILPSSRFLNPRKMLASRSDKEIHKLIHDGEKSTWPNLEKIRIQTNISRTLNKIVKEFDHNILTLSQSKSAKKSLKLVNKT